MKPVTAGRRPDCYPRVDGGRLRPAGVGMVAPTATNDSEDGRAKNRRVELVKL